MKRHIFVTFAGAITFFLASAFTSGGSVSARPILAPAELLNMSHHTLKVEDPNIHGPRSWSHEQSHEGVFAPLPAPAGGGPADAVSRPGHEPGHGPGYASYEGGQLGLLRANGAARIVRTA